MTCIFTCNPISKTETKLITLGKEKHVIMQALWLRGFTLSLSLIPVQQIIQDFHSEPAPTAAG